MDVLLLLLGTVVGAAGSVAGSMLLGRHELTRTARIRLFEELLPPLIAAANSATIWTAPIERPQMQELYRAGVLAGRRERALAERATNAWTARSAAPLGQETDDDGNWIPAPNGQAAWEEANDRLLWALISFSEFVEDKIR